MCHRLCSFMHKHPEDPSEVPGGFLSDINPVSTGKFLQQRGFFGLTGNGTVVILICAPLSFRIPFR